MKITRHTFTRKALTFGIIVFMSVALVASGFAAWLISSGSKVEGDGNVKVEVIQHADIQISVVGLSDGKLSNSNIYFAPKSTDESGYIKHTPTTGEGAVTLTEQLSFDLSATVSNADKIGKLTFTLKVSEGVIRAAGFEKNEGSDVWTYNSAKAYILLPTYAMDANGAPLPKVVKNEDGTFDVSGTTEAITLEEATNTGDFKFVINGTDGTINAKYTFGWGEAVNGINPGISLDEADSACDGSNIPACAKDKNGNYSLDNAELTILLINAIVNGQKVNGVDAHTIDVSTLESNLVKEYINTLTEAQKNMTGATFTVVINAMPK